jgi:NitT/TauT family transport system ATP-binding protein
MLEVTGLTRGYGHGRTAGPAIDGVSFSIGRGEIVTITGPSGCGKSTLLRCVAGLLRSDSGQVLLDGIPVTGVPDRLAVVFQDYARSLYPWLTVAENVALPLRRKFPRRDRRSAAIAALDSVGLADAAGQHPWQLSGGMQQRAAIARAIAADPVLLLMDEPFGSLDTQAREDLEDLTLRARAEHGITTLLVTHDIDEAVYAGDRVIVLTPAPGRIHADLPVPLPSPRDQMTTRQLPEFARLRAEVSRLARNRSGLIPATSPAQGHKTR